jgi:hypothetical protein
VSRRSELSPLLPGLPDLGEVRGRASRVGLIVLLLVVLLGVSWAYAAGQSLVAVLVIGGVLAVIARRHFDGDRLVYAVIALSVLGTLLLGDLHIGDRQVGDVATAGLGQTAKLGELLLNGLKTLGGYLVELVRHANEQATTPPGPRATG